MIEPVGDGGIISLIERVARFTLIKYIENKTIKNVNKFISSVTKKYTISSIITDDGKDCLQLHKLKSNNSPLEIYYCNPGVPYKRASRVFDEQLRRFIKKKSVIASKSIRKIKHCTNIINNKYLNVLN